MVEQSDIPGQPQAWHEAERRGPRLRPCRAQRLAELNWVLLTQSRVGGGIRLGSTSVTSSRTRWQNGLVIPCCAPATTSPRQISRWFDHRPEPDMAVVCRYRLHKGFRVSRSSVDEERACKNAVSWNLHH